MELREVFEPIVKFLKNLQRKDKEAASKDYAKERLQLVLMQDRASVSPDFFEMMKKEIIEVIKKYIEIDEESLEVQLTRGFEDADGTGPALFANIPIKNIKPVAKKIEEKEDDSLVVEVVNNQEIIDENVSSTEKVTEDNLVKEATAPETVNLENVDEQKKEKVEETVEQAEKIETIPETEVQNTAVESENEELQSTEDAVKEKIAEVKDGVVETIEKVKKGAKDGINKIKTKTQKKKINE